VPDRLKLRVWTPLPPQRSGVADHNLLLLPELAKLCDVTVVTDDALVSDLLHMQSVTVAGHSELERIPADLSIYHMGNHHGLHRRIHDELIADPGVVVLHDPSLVDFYRAFHRDSPDGFAAEVAMNHGPPVDQLPKVRVGAHWHIDRLKLQLVRRIVDPSLAVVVHSAWARDVLRRQFPLTPIHHVELAAPAVSQPPDEPDMRRRCGWRPDDVVFGLLGGLWQHKRPELAVKIFAALHLLRPRTRLLVAGRLEDADAVARMRETIWREGVEASVTVLTDVDDDEFTACISACDTVVDLRWPSAGETSATMMRAFGAGRPVVVSDLPQYGALDGGFCWRVPTAPPEAAAATLEVMLSVTDDPSVAARAGWRARRFVEESATLVRVAQRYESLAREVVAAARGPSTSPHTSVESLGPASRG
jgi:glycosyltransferase involved in cell wall biosynthesis